MANSVRLNDANIEHLLREPAGPVMSYFAEAAEDVRAVAAEVAPGTLGEDITVELRDGKYLVGHTAAKPHAKWVMGGTGIRADADEYPPGTTLPMSPLTPKQSRYMHWINESGPYAGEWFMKSVRGQFPNPYLRRALEAVFSVL